jgi:hypothetical protein
LEALFKKYYFIQQKITVQLCLLSHVVKTVSQKIAISKVIKFNLKNFEMANFFDSVFTPWDSKQGYTVFDL